MDNSKIAKESVNTNDDSYQGTHLRTGTTRTSHAGGRRMSSSKRISEGGITSSMQRTTRVAVIDDRRFNPFPLRVPGTWGARALADEDYERDVAHKSAGATAKTGRISRDAQLQQNSEYRRPPTNR